MISFRNITILIAFCVVFVGLRLSFLQEFMTAGTDQGLHLLAIYDLAVNNNFTLLGPPSSFALQGGRAFFFGPLTFYFGVPFVKFLGLNPLNISYGLILTQLIAVLVASFAIAKKFGFRAAYIFASLMAFSQTMVHFSQFLWNTNLMIPLACFVLATQILIPRNGSWKKFGMIWLLGLFWGLGLQAHYAFSLVIIPSLLMLAWKNKLDLKYMVALGLGFGIGFLPLIIFEVRNKFYNTETIFLYVQAQFQGKGDHPNSFPIHYFLFAFPFGFFCLALLLQKVFIKQRILIGFGLTVFIYFSLTNTLTKPARGFLMPQGLSFVVLSDMRDKILSEGQSNYNIIDFMTGDARAAYLRALLTYAGKPPMGVEEYPIAKTTYIFGKMPLSKILKSNLWEAQAVANSKLVKEWQYPNGVKLYMVSRPQETK